MAADHVDHVLAAGRWTFNSEVADVFDDMLRRSIPQYDEMRALVERIGAHFVQPSTDVVDLGCARGDALDPFVRAYGAQNRFIGIEASAPMAMHARERFAGYIRAGIVEIRDLDLRQHYAADVRSSLTLLVLTLQFVPIEHRARLLRDVFLHTVAGGALVLVEKILGPSARLDALLTDEYLAMKRRHGYSDDEIARKRLALEGVLVPVTARWNEEMLRNAGFVDIECIWRWVNFAAWVAVRP
jgi:tRNA (cmo5U34)-methyltransferase